MDSKIFEETYQNIKNGVHNHEFTNLIQWIKSEFDIDVFNVIYDEVRQDKMPRLNFILKNTNDLKLFRDKVGILDNSKVTPYFEKNHPDSEKYKTKGVYIITESFENACLTKISQEAEELKQTLSNKHSEIWMIQQMYLNFIVFTYQEDQIKLVKPLENELHQIFFETLKPYDEFGFLDIRKVNIHFDSKENLDKNYGGSWMRYFN